MADDNENYMRIPKPFAPAEVGGKVTDAEYIKDGNKNQHQINNEKLSDVENPEEDGLYVRKNGVWSKLEIEDGIVENSSKLAKSGDVFEAIKNSSGIEAKDVKLEVSYNNENHKIKFKVASNSPNNLQANVSLLLLSINTSYNQSSEELRVSNIIDILILTPTLSSIEKYIPVYPEDRVFYFVLINDNPNVQLCTLNTNTLIVPGSAILDNNQITATLLDPSDNNGVQAIKFTAVHAVDVDVECRVNCPKVVGDKYSACYVRGTILAGQSSVIIPVVSTYMNRTAALSIVPQQTSSQYTYILSNNSINVVGVLQLNVISGNPHENTPIIAFGVENDKLPASNVKLKLSFPRSNIQPLEAEATLQANSLYTLFDYTNYNWNGPNVYVSIDEATSRDNTYVYSFGQMDDLEVITNVRGNGQPW